MACANQDSTSKDGKALSHEEWVRRKDHETELKKKLILEAQKDLKESMLNKQSEDEMRKEQRRIEMIEWEENKRQEIEVDK